MGPGSAFRWPADCYYELLQLAQRGRDARAAAERRFAEGELPLVDFMLQLRCGVIGIRLGFVLHQSSGRVNYQRPLTVGADSPQEKGT